MNKLGSLLLNVFLWLYFIVSLYPLIWMIFYSFKNNDEIFVTNPLGIPTHFRFENYITAWQQFNIPRYFFNSFLVSTVSTAGVIILAVMFAYGVARMRWKFNETARVYMTFGMFIPVQVLMIPLAIIVKDLHFSNTYFTLIIPYIAFGLSFATIVFYGFYRSIPFELEESACVDGANIYRGFVSIILPIISPAIATMIIFQFLSWWNEFTMAYILISNEALKTLPLGLLFFAGLRGADWGAMGAIMTIVSLPTVVVYLIFSENVERAFTVGSAVKG
jgi:raffinose/stachyose/melibiose transport system permease protein